MEKKRLPLKLKHIVTLLVLLFSFNLFSVAQDSDKMYLFDKFENATIFFTSGSQLECKMNYNIVFRQMIYDDKGTLKALSPHDIASISTVKINNRIFIPFDSGICELLSIEPYIIVEYSSLLKPQKINIGYGQTTSTSSATNINQLVLSGRGVHEIKSASIPEADLILTYIVKKEKNYKKFRTLSQLRKTFSDKKELLEKYLLENKSFDLNKTLEVKKLVEFLYNQQ